MNHINEKEQQIFFLDVLLVFAKQINIVVIIVFLACFSSIIYVQFLQQVFILQVLK